MSGWLRSAAAHPKVMDQWPPGDLPGRPPMEAFAGIGDLPGRRGRSGRPDHLVTLRSTPTAATRAARFRTAIWSTCTKGAAVAAPSPSASSAHQPSSARGSASVRAAGKHRQLVHRSSGVYARRGTRSAPPSTRRSRHKSGRGTRRVRGCRRTRRPSARGARSAVIGRRSRAGSRVSLAQAEGVLRADSGDRRTVGSDGLAGLKALHYNDAKGAKPQKPHALSPWPNDCGGSDAVLVRPLQPRLRFFARRRSAARDRRFD